MKSYFDNYFSNQRLLLIIVYSRIFERINDKGEDRFGVIETLKLEYESQHVTLITAHYDKCR